MIKSKGDESAGDEKAFRDQEDDLIESFEPDLHLPLPLQKSSIFLNSNLQPDNASEPIDHVARIVFECIMSEVLYAVTSSIPYRFEEIDDFKADIISEPLALCALAYKVLAAIAKGSFKRLLSPYFCRVLIVHCGIRAKMSADTSNIESR